MFGGSGGGGGSSTSGVAKKTQSEGAAKEAAAEPEQKKVEKTNFDIELKAIDPAKKILVIKEVRLFIYFLTLQTDIQLGFEGFEGFGGEGSMYPLKSHEEGRRTED